MSDLITQKLDELITLAQIEGEPNVQIVLLGLSGARTIRDDGLLAEKVQEFIKDVLLPKAKRDKNSSQASLN